jgi:hypothetical protein
LLPWWKGGALLQRLLKENSPGESLDPNQDPALSSKVTTGGLSAPISRWNARCHLLWIGLLSMLHFLASMLKSHNGRKGKGHFPARQ